MLIPIGYIRWVFMGLLVAMGLGMPAVSVAQNARAAERSQAAQQKPVPSDEEYMTSRSFSEDWRSKYNQLSNEEKEALKKRLLSQSAISVVLNTENLTERKYLLGLTDIQKFWQHYEQQFEADRVQQRKRARQFKMDKTVLNSVIKTHCVVVGVVKEIQTHAEGPYHTWVTIRVEEYLKGGDSAEDVIVKSLAGGNIINPEEIYWPGFSVGERVLLTLSKLPWSLQEYRLQNQSNPRIRWEDYPQRNLLAYPITPLAHPNHPASNIKMCEGYYELWHKFPISEHNTILNFPPISLDAAAKTIRYVLYGDNNVQRN